MPRGVNATPIRENVRPEPELHQIIWRNATLDDLKRLQEERTGTLFQADTRRYRIVEMYRDSLNRIIAVGNLEETDGR